MNYKHLYSLIISFLLVLGLDYSSKVWAEATLQLYQPQPVMGEIFRFTLGYNSGVAFGMFANGGIWPLVVTGLVITGLLVWLTMNLLRGIWPPLTAWPIGFVLGGAIGNFADRLVDGHVTDFLDVGIGATRWPTFNIADSFIVVGLFLLIGLTNQPAPIKEDLALNSSSLLEKEIL
jgi:signal peptidase II